MREILFRGKRKDTREWTQGYLFRIWEKAYICWGTVNDVPDMKEVIPETVCQYTGLTDKNGKKIFEGDILLCIDKECSDDILRELIVWNRFSWVTRRNKRDIVMSEWECENMEIIGNIFDNPELLKEDTEDANPAN